MEIQEATIKTYLEFMGIRRKEWEKIVENPRKREFIILTTLCQYLVIKVNLMI